MTKYGMASSQVSSVTSPESGGRSEIPNLGGNDSSPILVTGHKLNGHNYLQWSQSVLPVICGKGKDEYLTGEAVMPETTEPGFRKWKIENSMIMLNQLYMTSAKESSQLLSITTHSQGNWMMLEAESWALNPCQVSGRLFQRFRREESRKKVMMGSKEQPAPTLDASALAARSFNSSGGDRQKRDRPWCDYCKKPGHYKETCWKLHGKPADWKPKPQFDRDGRAHVAANSESTSVPEPSPFNKEQMEMLQKLLSQVGSGSTTGVAFTANRGGMRPWIVDTGASDHMTGDAAILQNYKPSNGHSSVHIADGSKSKIAGIGLEIGEDDWPVLNCVPGSTSFHVANSQTKSLKQVASSLRSHQIPSQFAPTELSTPMPPSVQPAQHTNVPSPVTIQSPMPIQPIAPQLANENLQVYIRRRKRQELEHGSQSTCGQYIDSNSSLPEENIGEDRAGEVLIPSIDDSTLPIALRKGVRRCTDHPIGNYVTYEGYHHLTEHLLLLLMILRFPHNTRGIKNFRMEEGSTR
ncbi:hypothetical protein CK203_034947 [Vitis vinifera]|uniref:Retrovirus-related Pol polyprotein from transposon TNT 1-94-like beta-barrel domain-containing protein n=1 Tax=Vitis vinifera TaxID=29760 RepID=A0A438FYQ7_VITVI|nr:hypothetical protein CK203_034947 [Vitis vinifera]